jgi:hypothetical protein
VQPTPAASAHTPLSGCVESDVSSSPGGYQSKTSDTSTCSDEAVSGRSPPRRHVAPLVDRYRSSDYERVESAGIGPVNTTYARDHLDSVAEDLVDRDTQMPWQQSGDDD